MVVGSGVEKISLWGVLHEGELARVRTVSSARTATMEIVVPHLGDWYRWPAGAGIGFNFTGVSELKISQWISDPANRNQSVRSRRWSRREWDSFESVVPPHKLEVLEAALYRAPGMCRLEIAGYEHDEKGRTDNWLEIVVAGTDIQFTTPSGVCDIDRLLQIGDSYWDNLDKKKKR